MRLSSWPDRDLAALLLARALAWALLLAGWVGGGMLALVLAPRVLQAQALVALWLLALGGASALWSARRPGGRLHRAALLGAAAVAAAAWMLAARGGGLMAVAIGLAAWALLLAAASGVVRARRQAVQGRSAGRALPSPAVAAALGAALAWMALGDAADAMQLGPRLGGLALAAAAGLALLRPAASGDSGDDRARAGCRAGLFDCSLPAWPSGVWQDPARWPQALALLAMLPMMCALPLMLQQCRDGGASASWLLAGHWAAMFGPALGLSRWAPRLGAWPAERLAWPVAWLLGVALWAAASPSSPAFAMSAVGVVGAVGVAHGLAWSLAWQAQLGAPRAAQAPRGRAALVGTALRQALIAAAVGVALAEGGPAALLPLQAALGAAALGALGVAAAARVAYAGRKPSIDR